MRILLLLAGEISHFHCCFIAIIFIEFVMLV